MDNQPGLQVQLHTYCVALAPSSSLSQPFNVKWGWGPESQHMQASHRARHQGCAL